MPYTAAHRTAVTAVLAIATLGLLPLVADEPATAHSALTASNPADGATVDSPLDRVDLTFNEAPLTGLDAGLRIEVRDASGQDVSTGEVLVEGTTMAKAVDLEPGAYDVLWRYVSPDGHPITGELTFTATTSTSTEATATPTAPTTPTPTRDAVAPTTATPSPSPVPTPAASAWSTPLPWIGAGVIVALAAVSIPLYLRARRLPADR